jgi:hypothetical protein
MSGRKLADISQSTGHTSVFEGDGIAKAGSCSSHSRDDRNNNIGESKYQYIEYEVRREDFQCWFNSFQLSDKI